MPQSTHDFFYLQLTANNSTISGDVSVSTVGGIDVSFDHIEGFGFYHELTIPPGGTASKAAGTTHGPITFIKRRDRSTPRLMQALDQNQTIVCAIKFFARSLDTGSAYLSHVYQVQQGAIVAIRSEVLNRYSPEGAQMPAVERVSLAYRTLTVIHAPTSTEWVGQVGNR